MRTLLLLAALLCATAARAEDRPSWVDPSAVMDIDCERGRYWPADAKGAYERFCPQDTQEVDIWPGS